MRLVPFDTLIECHSRATEDIQRTANCQIHSSLAGRVDLFQVLQIARTSGIGHRDGTPVSQSGYQFLVDTLLQALYICSVDQELGAIWFQ